MAARRTYAAAAARDAFGSARKKRPPMRLPRFVAEWCNDSAAEMAVFADAEHLHRIAANLIRNAAQASTNAGKAVRILARARVVRDITVVEICDTGPGVPEHLRARLFRAVRRVDAQGRRRPGIGDRQGTCKRDGRRCGAGRFRARRFDFRHYPAQRAPERVGVQRLRALDQRRRPARRRSCECR